MLLLLPLLLLRPVAARIGDATPSPAHPQRKFCRADFVVKATIQRSSNSSSQGPPGYVPLDMSIRTQFKIPSSFLNTANEDLKLLWVPQEEVHLFSTNTKYIISGSVQKSADALILHWDGRRDWADPWEGVSQRLKATLRKQLMNGACQCYPSISKGRPACLKEETLNGPDKTGTWACYVQDSFCRPSPDGRCKWSNNRQLKTCLGR